MNSFLALSNLCQSEPLRPSRTLRENDPSPVLKFKYVIFRAQGIETFSMVPPFAQHSDAINLAAKKPISAGFAWRDADGAIHVEGESTSLHLKSRPEDAVVIHQTLIMNGL